MAQTDRRTPSLFSASTLVAGNKPTYTYVVIHTVHIGGRVASGVNLFQNLGGHQGEARRAELRVEASRPVGPRGGGDLGEGDMPPPHQLGIMGSTVSSPSGVRGEAPVT